MRCNSLHHIFVTLLFLLSVNAFPLRLFQRQSTHELTAGSSNDDIRCEDARDCAAAGFGIPSNSHYKCNRKGICTYDCNYNYTSLGGACWLNGTVSTSCNCTPSRSATSTLLPTPPPPTTTAIDDNDDDDEEEEVITVTETSFSVITASSPQTVPPPMTFTVPPPPRSTSTRPPRYVTITELSISTVPYVRPTTSRHRSTRTKTKTVTVTSISISTASPSKSSKASKSSRTSSPAPLPTNCCSRTSECKQKVPQDAHRICLKALCSWRCNKGYLKKGGKCVAKPSTSTKPALPPCGCVFPSSTSSSRSKSPSTTSSTQPQATVQPTATVTQTIYAGESVSTMSSMITIWTAASPAPAPLDSTLTLWTAADPTTVWTAADRTTIWTAPSATTIWTAASERTIWTAASPTPNTPTPTVTVTTRVPFSIAPVRPLPTPRIIYIETCSCDEDCTINAPADATPICDPRMATCTWACNPGFWISSDGTGCLPDGTAFAAFSRQLVVLSPTGTQPHTAFLERPTPSSLSSAAPTTITNQSVSPTGALNQLIVEAPPSVDISSNSTLPRNNNSTSFGSTSNPFLIQNYSTNRFFDKFFFADSADESNTFVNYLEMEEASEMDLTSYTNSTVTLSMDRVSNLSDSERRDSVRLSSKELVQPGSLLVVDLAHIPTGCFVFPSIYLHSANSSESSKIGEIDLFDGSSARDFNRYSVRSPTSCSLTPSTAISGEVQSTTCAMSEGGCAVRDLNGLAGDEMNRKGGGVIALRLAEDGIQVWQWDHSQVPNDISSSPRPKSWGDPTAAWMRDSCDINKSFRDLRLAFDITTCGDWKGKPATPFAEFGSCAANYATCEAAVQDPANFAEAYFEINSVKVYSL